MWRALMRQFELITSRPGKFIADASFTVIVTFYRRR
jgi:hypothetical protein